MGLSQYEETQRVKAEEKRLRKKTVDHLQPSYVPSVVGTATAELVFTATKDAAQWVQIYDLLTPTDANDY